MNSKIIALTFRGLRRRFKNILRSMVLVVLAFTFVTGVLLLQENMSNWQKADNKKHFGDWFVMYRSKQPEENESIKNHPYTGNVYTAKTVTSVKDRTNLSDIMIGTMSDGFISMGSIALEKGKMPDNDNEAAIDRNSLIRLGQGTDIGDNITLNDKEYTLCGIMNSYTNVWNDGKKLPGIIVTENEADNIATDETYIYAYSLQSFIDEQDYSSIAENLRKESGLKFNFTYNSNVYDYKPWGYAKVNNYIYVFIMLVGITIISYQITMYNKTRKNVRFIQKCLGADKGQIIFMILTENIFILLISAVIGFGIASGTGYVIQALIKYFKNVSFFSIGQYTLIRIILTLVIAVAVSFMSEIITDRLSSLNRKKRTYNFKNVMTEKTFVKTTAKRFITRRTICITLVFISVFVLRIFAAHAPGADGQNPRRTDQYERHIPDIPPVVGQYPPQRNDAAHEEKHGHDRQEPLHGTHRLRYFVFVHLVEVLALALVAFVIHHPDACKHEQYGHDEVEYTIAVRQGPEYIDSEPHERHDHENHGNSKSLFVHRRIIKLVSILGTVTQQPWDGRCTEGVSCPARR